MNASVLRPFCLKPTRETCFGVSGLIIPGGQPVGIVVLMLQVFVVFSNHLDVGYTDNLDGSCAGAVVNRYFDQHFPNAIKTAAEFKQVCAC